MGTKRGEPARFIEDAIGFSGGSCLIWPFSRGGTTGRARAYFPSGRDERGRLIFKEKDVHRVICERVHGTPPSGHEAAHSCGNGRSGCISPHHLRWATHAENEDDKIAHGTHNRGERNGIAKLTAEDVVVIRESEGVVPRRELAARFGINPWYVRNLQKNRAWRWL
jgi:hypothetical protein